MLQRLLSVKNVAKFLSTPEDTVNQLLEEGRLGGVLVAELSRKGVSVTPGLKNSVGMVVQAISPKTTEAVSKLERESLLASEATVTIMFTDIVASTEITEHLGDQRARELFKVHNEIIRRQTKAHGGVEVKSIGDGFMMTFRSVRRAVACAVASQVDLAEYNKEHREVPIIVRMGLSIGEPIREEEDLFGRSVVLAARISSKAQGQQIFICQTVHSLIAGSREFTFREKGDFELKGFARPHPLYEVLWRQS